MPLNQHACHGIVCVLAKFNVIVEKCMWLNTDIIMLSTQGVSTYSSMEENDGASSCDGREYVHSNSEEGKGH